MGEYNIWYHRHLGYDQKTAKPETRLSVADDTGLTTAGLDSSICLNFARGNCIKGYKCHWKHQIPTEDDELRVSMLKDVFGRGRHGTDREDMDGTGNFNRNNRTLYLGGVVCKEDVRDTEKLVKADFSQFGELEYVRAIPAKAIAFVRFKLRTATEFARESMNGQTTPYGEISVKWAHVDPNPLAKEFDKRADDALAQYAIAKRIMEMSDEKREAWQQLQQVQNGNYPTNQLMSAVLNAPSAKSNAPPLAISQSANSALPHPQSMPAPPPGVDPARAAQFAAYWAHHHAVQTAKALGLEPPPAPEAPAAPIARPASVGRAGVDGFAVNPYSQAQHPYANRNYGRDRDKNKLSEAEKDRKRQKRTVQERLQKDSYDSSKDANHSYGPSSSSSSSSKRERDQSSSGAPQKITPGVASQQAHSQGPVYVPAARGKKAKATQEEMDALMNDEPLAF